jgi:Ftsk/SpoIIIE family protein
VAQVEAALAAGRQVIASATTQGAVGTYRGALATLKERADLVILWPGLGPASQVSHLSLHGTVDPRALTVPGRGVLVSRRSVTPLQCVGPAS